MAENLVNQPGAWHQHYVRADDADVAGANFFAT